MANQHRKDTGTSEIEERGIRVFASRQEEPDSDAEVFYNPEMVLNRDLSERAFKQAAETQGFDHLRTVDATAASGIRGIRYSEFSDSVVFCDPDPAAVESVEKALRENDPQAECEVLQKDANVVLSGNRGGFQLVDVDPFGPFTEFLDSAARASSHNSFAGFTATDVAVPAGSYSKTCIRRYGSVPLKNSFMHETALRIYIHEIFRNYARFDKAFDPKLCFQHRHFCRVMGRVTESRSRCNRALDDIGFLSFCPGCRWRRLERYEKCQNCGNGDLKHAGPLWTGKIADSRFTESMLVGFPEDWEESLDKLEKVHGEAELLRPFYSVHELSSLAGVSSPRREELLQCIEDIGYPVASSHFDPQAFKTTMPVEQLVDLVEELS